LFSTRVFKQSSLIFIFILCFWILSCIYFIGHTSKCFSNEWINQVSSVIMTENIDQLLLLRWVLILSWDKWLKYLSEKKSQGKAILTNLCVGWAPCCQNAGDCFSDVWTRSWRWNKFCVSFCRWYLNCVVKLIAAFAYQLVALTRKLHCPVHSLKRSSFSVKCSLRLWNQMWLTALA